VFNEYPKSKTLKTQIRTPPDSTNITGHNAHIEKIT